MTVSPAAMYTIDRIAPTRRPEGRVVMYQTWSELLFLHWVVPAEQIRPLLPPCLELDTFEGRAFVGLVPFTMTGVRPVWSPAIPGLSNFHETNVRTYVHYKGRNPGVWFFSLDAANAVAVRVARAAWKLPYHYARMELQKVGSVIDYQTERLWPGPLPGRCEVRYSPAGPVFHAPPGTLEHFLAERYILYAYTNGTLLSGQVHHTPYPLQIAEVLALEENLIFAAGIRRREDTPLAHYACGVTVNIFPLGAAAD